MVGASFIFQQKSVDGDFESLNATITGIAEAAAGYVGRKRWQDHAGNVCVTYYWDSMEALTAFARAPKHVAAKKRFAEWYAGYRVEICELLKTYGNNFYSDQLAGPMTAQGPRPVIDSRGHERSEVEDGGRSGIPY